MTNKMSVLELIIKCSGGSSGSSQMSRMRRKTPTLLPLIIKLTLILMTLTSHNTITAQPLINQLAVLFRARPPWPTTFPNSNGNNNENGNQNQNGQNQNQADQNNFNFQPQDFSHLNDLLTGHSNHNGNINFNDLQGQSQNNNQNRNENNGHGFKYIAGTGGGASLQQLYPTVVASVPPLLSSPILGSNGKAKAILIAHPVLGPNHLPPHLDHQMTLQQLHEGSTIVSGPDQSQNQNQNPSGSSTGGFYLPQNQNQNNNQNKQKFPLQLQLPLNFLQNNRYAYNHQGNNNQGGSKPGFSVPPGAIAIPGSPPPGGRVIAIPVAQNSPLLNHHFAVRQPLSTLTLTTSPPQFMPSQLLSTSKFNASPVDVTSAKITSTNPPTNSTTTTGTTSTTGTTTTTTTTIPTKSPKAKKKKKTHSISSSANSGEKESEFGSSDHGELTGFNFNPSYHYNNNYHRSTTTEIPRPSAGAYPPTTNTQGNNIQEVILNSQQLYSSPSTVVGTFRFPDPPTPPNLQSMNTRFELENKDVIHSHWTAPTAFKNAVAKKAQSPNGYFTSSISEALPSVNSIVTSDALGSSKWKFGSDSNSKAKKFDVSFKPSLQLHSFEDTNSGLKEYITVNPSASSKTSRDSKSLFASSSQHFAADDAKDLPTMESGFRPFNHFAFVNGVPGASISTTTETSVLNLIRNEFVKDMKKNHQNPWSTTTEKSRQDRKYFDGNNFVRSINSGGYAQVYSTGGSVTGSSDNNFGASTSPSIGDSETLSDGWVGRMTPSYSKASYGSNTKGQSGRQVQTSTSTSSSELYEDWLSLSPARKKKNDGESESYLSKSSRVNNLSHWGKNKNPLECEKFYRFGFCPVTPHYPLEQVESIGLRCSTLLSHLIAPLPKTDVRYDIIVPKNGSTPKGRSAAPSGWSWKTFAGKPVCDTKEVKIVPGWAKNEQGEWLVILQTEKWKQEAQISLCTSQGGNSCDQSTGQTCQPEQTKCVQRFTAQRLVVLDPEDTDRCPVVRSVFLPSACVCLSTGESVLKKSSHHPTAEVETNRHTNGHGHGHTSSSTSSSSTSSSSTDGSKNNKKSARNYSRVISGRSLSTSFFGLGDAVEGLSGDLETAADSSTSGEKVMMNPFALLTSSLENINSLESNSSEESKVNSTENSHIIIRGSSSEERAGGGSPVISVKNPANVTNSKAFMVITEKLSDSMEQSQLKYNNNNKDESESGSRKQQGTLLKNDNNFESSGGSGSGALGSSFIVSGTSEDSPKSSSDDDDGNSNSNVKGDNETQGFQSFFAKLF